MAALTPETLLRSFPDAQLLPRYLACGNATLNG
jgi:hypothetical protein